MSSKIQIKTDAVYLMRNGETCGPLVDGPNTCYPIEDPENDLRSWRIDGRFIDERTDHPFDILNEVKL